MASRDLQTLHSQTLERVQRLLVLAKGEGLELLVTSTFRSFEEQARLFEQGRTTPGRIVTSARPGSSFHNVRRALDVAFLRPSTGTLDWDWLSSSSEAAALWRRLGALGSTAGLSWGGLWQSPDRPHFEDTWCASCHVDVGPRGAMHFAESGECRKAAA